ncbi:Glycosyl Hydrolase Family 88 [Mariniphaga anaerophila]|uniref:Glycosyl Hydrolase Family 88 n=1 Tax=Mariniphaga anaerophila TaxID=1484053 RepID=A0A1M5A6L6_9BACT|nr:glycoside hydrolase family 88 protein [Mariniphaga anaerophila]SHF25948.1 Glycosyl Hydrolase Family 88 [Mariniphaga anaerophila]
MENLRKLKPIFWGTMLLLVVACTPKQSMNSDFVSGTIRLADAQEKLQVKKIEESGKILNPRTVSGGEVKYVGREDWTSGFFPGTMWYMYELTGDTLWRGYARKYTEALDSVKYLTWHHDVGFMVECSFGNGLRLGENEYRDVIVQAAKSLSSRFRPVPGIIQSWNVNRGWQSQRGWECPVIIDNMMNLELLFNATRLSGDSTFYNIAVSHANQTLKNQYRADNSCYHVVDYSLSSGEVRSRETAQGYAHESSWARGQAWGIYGFAVCYRETRDLRYLAQAKKAFEFIISHKNFPADFVPYWDFDAPGIPDEPRDASAAAIMASALYEIAGFDNYSYYKEWADKIMQSLASPAYFAETGENGGFLLMHSVGSIPHGQEIDVPLNYADYYFLEALKRKRDLENKTDFR